MNNKSPLVYSSTFTNSFLLQALCNSFVFDYATRTSIGGTNLSYFIIKQLPVFRPKEFDNNFCKMTFTEFILPRVFELTYTSWSLKSIADHFNYDYAPFVWNEDRRFKIKCELDAMFFYMYGLDADDIDHIIDSFLIVKRKDNEKYDCYLTKDTIFEIYSSMINAIHNNHIYKTILTPPPGVPHQIIKS